MTREGRRVGVQGCSFGYDQPGLLRWRAAGFGFDEAPEEIDADRDGDAGENGETEGLGIEVGPLAGIGDRGW